MIEDSRLLELRHFKRTQQLFPLDDAVCGEDERSALAGEPLRGVCPVCGEPTTFVGFTDNMRESGACAHCGSSNRQRQMALMLRRALALPAHGVIELPAGVRLFNTESTGPLHERLKSSAAYTFSEYWGPDHAPGAQVAGIRNEDLQSLSFSPETFDIVLSSDVLEHVPDPYRAHAEIFRVLKAGGRHLFTVPYYPWECRDEVRAELVDGKVVHRAEPLYHGDPIRASEGILVWRIFGLEMLVRLSDIGFNPRLWRLYEPSHGIIGTWCTFFEAVKEVGAKITRSGRQF